ncbi:MAG: ribosomal protein methyltransferase [Lacunisphaera sp.]|nr:ribosomal protein methyltransferase [Lacunisphaera sp.]
MTVTFPGASRSNSSQDTAWREGGNSFAAGKNSRDAVEGSAQSGPMGLFEIKTEIPVAVTEEVDTVLLEVGEAGWSLLEDAIERRAWIVGIFAGEAEARMRWNELRPLLPAAARGEPVVRALGDADWKDSYKAHFKAWKFGRLNWVPVWERETFRLPIGEEVLWLDPGMAFGTGNHETTRLVVERLVKFSAKCGVKGRVIDAGCGSGILALSAAKLGHRDVVAFDNDSEAVRVSCENAVLNGMQGRVDFFTGDMVSGLAGRQAELVLANIQADVLARFAGELCATVAADGALVLSGILAREVAQVRDAFLTAAPGWRTDSRAMGEWCDLVLTRGEGR